MGRVEQPAALEPANTFGPLPSSGLLAFADARNYLQSSERIQAGMADAPSCPAGAAAVTCPVTVGLPSPGIPSNSVRLTGCGGLVGCGRVEIFREGAWAAIGTSPIGPPDKIAKVVCQQLGLGFTQGLADIASTFAPPKRTVLWQNVECAGSEAALASCTFGNWVWDQNELGVQCFNGTDRPILSSAVRFVGGGAPSRGRPEVLYQGSWWPLCSENLNALSAALLCRQAGFNGGPAQLLAPDSYGTAAGAGYTQALLVYSFCNEEAISLPSCQAPTATPAASCAGIGAVQCVEGAGAPAVTARLASGLPGERPRVQLWWGAPFHLWAHVAASYGSDANDWLSAVVCRQLGLGPPVGWTSVAATQGAPQFSPPQCTGGEASIDVCGAPQWIAGQPELALECS